MKRQSNMADIRSFLTKKKALVTDFESIQLLGTSFCSNYTCNNLLKIIDEDSYEDMFSESCVSGYTDESQSETEADLASEPTTETEPSPFNDIRTILEQQNIFV